MPMAPRREEVGGVGVAELLVASTLATTSTPPPRAMACIRASGVGVLDFDFVPASAITSTLPGPGAGPLGEELCEVDVAEFCFVATSAQTPTSRTSDDAPPTAMRVSCVAILMVPLVLTATHDPPTACITIRITPGTGRRFVVEGAVVGERGRLRWKRISMLRARSPGGGTTPTVVTSTALHSILTLAVSFVAEYVVTCSSMAFRLSADMGMAMFSLSHSIRRAHRGQCPAYAEARGAELGRRTRMPHAEASGCIPLRTQQDGPRATHAAGMVFHLHTT